MSMEFLSEEHKGYLESKTREESQRFGLFGGTMATRGDLLALLYEARVIRRALKNACAEIKNESAGDVDGFVEVAKAEIDAEAQ